MLAPETFTRLNYFPRKREGFNEMIIDPQSMRRWVCRDHEWHAAPESSSERVLLPAGNLPPYKNVKWERLWPLRIPKLFHKLAETPPTEEGIVEFANRFGMLGLSELVNIPKDTVPDSGEPDPAVGRLASFLRFGEPLSAWQHEIEAIKLACECWSVIRHDDPVAFAGLQARIDSDPPPGPLGWKWWALLEPPANEPSADFLRPAWEPDELVLLVPAALEVLISRALHGRISGRLCHLDNEAGWEVVLEPNNLIAAIWLEFAQAVADGNWKDCVYCGVPFKPKNRRAEYCSDSHRSLAYQKRKRAKGESQ